MEPFSVQALMSAEATIQTNVPARLDRLPWARWHWLVVFALGFVWILDGLEVTIVGSIGPTLQKAAIHLSSFQVGLIGAFWIGSAVTGALLFGHLTDRWWQNKLFIITLALYLLVPVATAFSWNAARCFGFRFLTSS